jgi:hypothetical protein
MPLAFSSRNLLRPAESLNAVVASSSDSLLVCAPLRTAT